MKLFLLFFLFNAFCYSQNFGVTKAEIKPKIKGELIKETEYQLTYLRETEGMEVNYYFDSNDYFYKYSIVSKFMMSQMNAHDLINHYQYTYKDIRSEYPDAPVKDNSFIADFCENNYEKCMTLNNARKEASFFYTDKNRNVIKHTIRATSHGYDYLYFEESKEVVDSK